MITEPIIRIIKTYFCTVACVTFLKMCFCKRQHPDHTIKTSINTPKACTILFMGLTFHLIRLGNITVKKNELPKNSFNGRNELCHK